MAQTDYQQEQLEALHLVRRTLSGRLEPQIPRLRRQIQPYLAFRRDVDAFLQRHFSGICTRTCYSQRRSACCTKDGIITFFADTVINVLLSGEPQLTDLTARLLQPHTGFKCVYLGPGGCSWQLKPLVCAMFLCDTARSQVFGANPQAAADWQSLRRREKTFRYPDRLVLFEEIEETFMAAGCRSSLMYLHNSPGLLQVKKRAGRR